MTFKRTLQTPNFKRGKSLIFHRLKRPSYPPHTPTQPYLYLCGLKVVGFLRARERPTLVQDVAATKVRGLAADLDVLEVH